MISPNGIQGIAEIFIDGLYAIFERYPNFARAVYGTTYLLCLLYLGLFSEMHWFGACLFSLFLTLIFATTIILALHFGIKGYFYIKRKLND